MTDETRLAFDGLEARASVLADGAVRDRISLRDHVDTVEIGAFQAERGTTQRLRFNVVVEVADSAAPLDDDVDKILSYDTITEAIAHELAAERLNLLETLAERVADRILLAPQAHRVFIRIEKLDRGPGALGVEIMRRQPDAAEVVGDTVHPLVVYLGNDALKPDLLSKLLDEVSGGEDPLILCVGSPANIAPRSSSAAAQRRIDLLAIEQNAWVLAGLDRRCVVVATKTELDWAMKNGQISVWAPSKIVLDAVDGPDEGAVDACALAAWFAGEMAASRLLVVGAKLPDACPVPSEHRLI